ncbi:hypothetical protein ACAG26_24425 [Mycobacterium sp. pUA109]|uniref:hypothetical protein n=1 Tax=Mycobacterium sp. pUA109 TaxID=3238982 RepID=UPI00351BDA4A
MLTYDQAVEALENGHTVTATFRMPEYAADADTWELREGRHRIAATVDVALTLTLDGKSLEVERGGHVATVEPDFYAALCTATTDTPPKPKRGAKVSVDGVDMGEGKPGTRPDDAHPGTVIE